MSRIRSHPNGVFGDRSRSLNFLQSLYWSACRLILFSFCFWDLHIIIVVSYHLRGTHVPAHRRDFHMTWMTKGRLLKSDIAQKTVYNPEAYQGNGSCI